MTGHSDALQRLGDVMGHHDSKNGFVQFNSSYGGPPLFVQSDPRWVGTEGIKLFHSLLMAIRDAEREAYAAGIEHAKKCVDLALQQARR